MNCSILSLSHPQQIEAVESVTLPAVSGELEILPFHANAYIVLSTGVVRIRTHDGQMRTFSVSESLACIKDDHITIML